MIALLFLLPYLAILCELGTTWPSAQGIHYWVTLAFGSRWGARFSWYYWLNLPAWYPSTFLVCSGVLAELFYPELPLWGHVTVAIVLSWVSVWLVNCDRDQTRVLNTVGMLTRLMIVVTLIVGGIYHAVTQGMANPVNLETLSPQRDNAIMYLPTLVFSVIGAELIANLIFRVGNPRHDLPIGLFGGMLFLLFLHAGGTFAVLSAVPRDQLGLVSGLVQTFRIIFGSSFVGQLLTCLLGLATVVTFVCYMSLWALGGSEAAAAGAENGEMPGLFARRNLHTWQPAGAAFQTGLWSTLLLIIYGSWRIRLMICSGLSLHFPWCCTFQRIILFCRISTVTSHAGGYVSTLPCTWDIRCMAVSLVRQYSPWLEYFSVYFSRYLYA